MSPVDCCECMTVSRVLMPVTLTAVLALPVLANLTRLTHAAIHAPTATTTRAMFASNLIRDPSPWLLPLPWATERYIHHLAFFSLAIRLDIPYHGLVWRHLSNRPYGNL